MLPSIKGIDHVHIYVSDLDVSVAWYSEYLGFQVMPEFESWNTGVGPITMTDKIGKAHIALFKSDGSPSSAIAFGASGNDFVLWLKYFESKSLPVTVKDHGLAWSVYFKDPDENHHEITTYDCEDVHQYYK